MDPPDYIDDTGRFLSEPPKEGILATVKVTLTCGKEELIREFPVKLLPPERTELEEKAVELKAEAEENGEKTREAEEMVLPDSWKGTPIRWGTREDSPLGVGFLLLAVGLWYLYGKDDRELKKRGETSETADDSRLSGDSLQDEYASGGRNDHPGSFAARLPFITGTRTGKKSITPTRRCFSPATRWSREWARLRLTRSLGRNAEIFII